MEQLLYKLLNFSDKEKIVARIRYLKPDFFKDEHLVELSFWIRLLFAGLWNIADKAGRLEDRSKRIKAEIFPYEEKIKIEEGLNALCKIKSGGKRPFIIRYEIDGEKYIQIVNWHLHQKPHSTEKESIIPAPPKNIMEKGMVNGKGNGECLKQELLNNNVQITVKKPFSKDKYLEYVYLTIEENQKLIDKFGKTETKEYIERLNNYIGSTGKRYKSHYHTILNWSAKDLGTKSNSNSLLETEKRLKAGIKENKNGR